MKSPSADAAKKKEEVPAMEKYTVSLHNGSLVARQHNLRNEKVIRKEKHIQKGGHYEVWFDKDPKKTYKELFDEAIQKYNKSQPRKDRRIRDYYNKVKKSAYKHPVYEVIAQVGGYDKAPDEDVSRKILREYYDSWEKRNPNLVITGAYYHADEEGAPHLHIDYIPVAHNYTRGPEIQAGLVKALGEMGYIKKGRETAQIKWQRNERAHLEAYCKMLGFEIEHPMRGLPHQTTRLFKTQKALEEAQKELNEKGKQLEELEKNIMLKEENLSSIEKKADALGIEVDRVYNRLKEYDRKIEH